MIINNRLKGLVELDDLLRKAERDAVMHDTPEAHARHAVQQLRSGRPAHEVLKPHVDAYVKADHEHQSEAGAGLMGPGSGERLTQLSNNRDAARDRLHAVGRAIGHEPGHAMPRMYHGPAGHSFTGEYPQSHGIRLARAYGGSTSSHSTFDNEEGAHGFISSLKHHYPHAVARHAPPSESGGPHTVNWTHRHGPEHRHMCTTCGGEDS